MFSQGKIDENSYESFKILDPPAGKLLQVSWLIRLFRFRSCRDLNHLGVAAVCSSSATVLIVCFQLLTVVAGWLFPSSLRRFCKPVQQLSGYQASWWFEFESWKWWVVWKESPLHPQVFERWKVSSSAGTRSEVSVRSCQSDSCWGGSLVGCSVCPTSSMCIFSCLLFSLAVKGFSFQLILPPAGRCRNNTAVIILYEYSRSSSCYYYYH